MPAGTILGQTYSNSNVYLEAWNEEGKDYGENWFQVEQGELRTTKPIIPSMLTCDEQIIRQDCLGYLMEWIKYP